MIHFGDAINNSSDLVTIENSIDLVLRFDQNTNNEEEVDIQSIVDKSKNNKQYVIPKKTISSSASITNTHNNINTLKISNIGYNATEEDIREIFNEYGTIRRLNIPRNRKTRQPLDYAFITFDTKYEAQKVLDSGKRFILNYCILDVSWSN